MPQEFWVTVARDAFASDGCVMARVNGDAVQLSRRELVILSALAAPVEARGAPQQVRARLTDTVPQRLQPLVGVRNRFLRALFSITPSGRHWRDLLAGWSDDELASDIARLTAAGCIRSFTPESTCAPSASRGVGVICEAPGPALTRFTDALARVCAPLREPVAIVSGESGAADGIRLPTATWTLIGQTRRDACIARLTPIAGGRDLVSHALKGDKAGPNTGAHRNLLMLDSGFGTVVCLDQDVEPHAYAKANRAATTHVSGIPADPLEWDEAPSCRTSSMSVVPAEAALPDLLSARLGRRFRDIAALGPALVWRDLQSWDAWPDHWWDARVAIAWTGVISEGDTTLTRGALYLDGPSRATVMDRRDVYDAVTRAGRVALCAPAETLLPAGSFMGKAFAYDQQRLVPPFPPAGRQGEVVFGTVLGRIHQGALACSIPAMVWHEQSASPDARESCADVTLTCAQLLSMLATEVIIRDSLTEPGDRMIALGKHLAAFGAQPVPEMADAIARRVRRLLEIRWANLFRLRTTYDAPPWWLLDVETLSSRIRHIIAGHQSPLAVCRSALAEPIETVAARVRQYGELLQIWPAIWAHRRFTPHTPAP